jgi:hypothetical protein
MVAYICDDLLLFEESLERLVDVGLYDFVVFVLLLSKRGQWVTHTLFQQLTVLQMNLQNVYNISSQINT